MEGRKNTLLWKIQATKESPASYLFGTIHVRDARAFRCLDVVTQYLLQCDTFATEFEFSEADPQQLMAVFALPETQTLDKILPRGAWNALQYHARKRLGIDAQMLRSQHPMQISTLLSGVLFPTETPVALDETLWQLAKASGKKTLGVETFQHQIQTIQAIPMEQHVRSLIWLVKHYGRQRKRYRKMLQWYEQGNIRKLYKAGKKDAKGMRRILLYDRNKAMTERLIAFMQEGSIFCAVGAGHLAGGKGMLRRLKKAGYLVKPVPLDLNAL